MKLNLLNNLIDKKLTKYTNDLLESAFLVMFDLFDTGLSQEDFNLLVRDKLKEIRKENNK